MLQHGVNGNATSPPSPLLAGFSHFDMERIPPEKKSRLAGVRRQLRITRMNPGSRLISALTHRDVLSVIY